MKFSVRSSEGTLWSRPTGRISTFHLLPDHTTSNLHVTPDHTTSNKQLVSLIKYFLFSPTRCEFVTIKRSPCALMSYWSVTPADEDQGLQATALPSVVMPSTQRCCQDWGTGLTETCISDVLQDCLQTLTSQHIT